MSLEQHLRRVLTDDRHTMPAWPDPVTRVAAGIGQRQQRRRAAVAVAGILVGIVIMATGLLARPHRITAPVRPDVSHPGVIAWLDAPATRPTTFARAAPLPVARPCTADDLSPTTWAEDRGVVDGRWVQTLVVTSGSDETCTLSGSARLRGIPPGAGTGESVPATHLAPAEGSIRQYPATLRPNTEARIDLAMAAGCLMAGPSIGGGGPQPYPRYANLELRVDDVEIPADGLVIMPDCPVAIGDWYLIPPLRAAPLTVTIEAPARVHRGQILAYEVVVLNTLGVDVALSPCPVYEQKLDQTAQWLHLNCAVTRFPPHQPVRFAMRIQVPADTSIGPALLSWMAVLGDGRVAIANPDFGGVVVQIVP